MTTPLLDLTDPDNPCTSPAFLGYRVCVKTGRMFWRVCAWCETKAIVEAEARRLRLEITHSMCQTHYAEQIAQITGETTL